jgi:hypothetical protein
MGAGGFWSGVVRRRTLSAERELGVIGPLCDETILYVLVSYGMCSRLSLLSLSCGARSRTTAQHQ